MDGFELWDHQSQAIDRLREMRMSGVTRIVLSAPCGSGKTEIACELVKSARGKGRNIVFTVPLLSLIDQAVGRFELRGIEAESIGVVQGKHARTNEIAPIQVASVQTLARRPFPLADLVIIDECHIQHEVIKKWIAACPEITFIGLSATPFAAEMALHWQELIVVETIQGLIDKGVLSPFRTFAPLLKPDIKGVRIVGGDYVEGELSEIMQSDVLIADCVRTWLEKAHDRATLAFCVDRAHASKLTDEFTSVGVRARYVDANTEMDDRADYLEQLRTGEVQVVVSISTMTCGVDVPWVSCIIMARPTRSQMLFVQSVSRGLRAYSGKVDAIILDHSMTTNRMGLITDIGIHKLRGGKKDKGESVSRDMVTPLPWECLECHAIVPPRVNECPECGFRRSPQSEIVYVNGDLVEVGKDPPVELKKGDDVSKWTGAQRMRFFAELLGIAEMKGRKRGWAYHTYVERCGVKPFRDPPPVFPPSPATAAWVREREADFIKSMRKAG